VRKAVLMSSATAGERAFAFASLATGIVGV
jgi:hypothetical protein